MPDLIPRQTPPPRLPVSAEAASPSPPEPGLPELVAMLQRQRLTMVLCVLFAVSLAGIYILLARPVYEATSVLRFEQEQLNLPQLVQQFTTENRISTELELLQGRGAAEAVIDSLGLRARLVAPRKGAVTRLFPTLRVTAAADTGILLLRLNGDSAYVVHRAGTPSWSDRARLNEPVDIAGVTLVLARPKVDPGEIRLRVVSLDDAVRDFDQALKASRPARDADLIAVRFRAPDPDLAARAANLLAGGLIARRQSELRRRTGIAVDYLREQLDTLGKQLRVAEDTLRAYREAVGAVDPAEQARTQVGRLSQLEADRAGLNAERQALAALLEKIRQQPPGTPEAPSPYRRLIAFPALLRNQAAAELLNSLAVVENERSALLRRRTWQDADVQMLTTRINELDRQLQTIAETYLEGLTNQVAALDQAGRQFGRQLDSLPNKELNTARLERQARVQQEMYSLVQTRLKEAEITQAMQDPTVRIADPAVPADRPVSPRPLLDFALSIVLGGLLGLTVSLGRELGDRSVRSRADALQAAGLPVVGAIPRLDTGLPRSLRRLAKRRKQRRSALPGSSNAQGWATRAGFGLPSSPEAAAVATRLVTQPDTPGGYAEAFNQLHVNLGLAFPERPIKVLVFSSPLPGEGKTLAAINFALTTAARGLKVLLIDGDLRCGIVNQVFGCARQPGFSELLAGATRLEDAQRGILVTPTGSLAMLPSGALLRGPSQALAVDRLRRALESLGTRFDLVVLDSPPVNILADAALLGAAADGVVLVVRAGRTHQDALSFAMEQLSAARAPVIGTLLNDIDLRHSGYDDGAYRYLAEVEKYHATHS